MHASRRLAGLFALALLVVGCVSRGGAGVSPTPSPTPPASPSPTPAPGSAFYLRAWQTQALAPQYTFSWLPVATISARQFIDGNVAVPAIYPAPLLANPSIAPISQLGIDTIVAEARRSGLLRQTSIFFGDPMPGAVVGHVTLIVDGVTYKLSGLISVTPGDEVTPEPGTQAAFAAFWQKVSDLTGWLGAEIGQQTSYDPERLAGLTSEPVAASSGITPNEVPWPLETPFASFGTPMGSVTQRCAVVSGTDLATLLPVVRDANQLTRFVDSDGVKRSLIVRVLVPDEPGPCA